MKKQSDWLDQEIADIKKEVRIKYPETKTMIKFLLFLLPFSLLAFSLQSHECPHCKWPLTVKVSQEVMWRCDTCQYYNSDSSGGDWKGDYYCGKCGNKK